MNGFPYIIFFSLTGLHTFCPKCSSKLYPLILHGPENFSKLGNLFTESNFQNQFTWRQITIFPANPSFASLTVKQVKLVGLNGVTLEWQFDLAGKNCKNLPGREKRRKKFTWPGKKEEEK